MGIVNNLYTLDEAAKKFFLLHRAVKVTYAELVGPDKLVAGTASRGRRGLHPFGVSEGPKDRNPHARRTGHPLSLGERPDLRTRGCEARGPHRKGSDCLCGKGTSHTPGNRSGECAEAASILENLRTLSEAAEKYYRNNDTTCTTYWQLVGPGKLIASITPREGEDYRSLLFKQGHPLRLYLKDGRVVVYPPPRRQKAP